MLLLFAMVARVDGTEHEACPSCGEGMGDYYEEDKYYLIIRSTGLFKQQSVRQEG